MQTVFSHIIQKRFSQVNEDVATDALAYILRASEAARNGMTKLLRGLVPSLPALHFKTQQSEGAIRPDMWGFAGSQPRVFVENKFWAGLTDNQPVSYLKQLAAYPQPSVLLIIAPTAREQSLWRELRHRLSTNGISTVARSHAAAVPCSMDTQLGPVLALTSWGNVLSVLEHECADSPTARGDLAQLRALCDSADADAFCPVTRSEISNQRLPAFILQLSAIVQAVIDLAVTEGVMHIRGLKPQASWDRAGRYVRVSLDTSRGAGAWFGVHFGLWKTHGTTPLWLAFYDGIFGRGQEVLPLLERWATLRGAVIAAADQAGIAVALEIPEGEEKDRVVRRIVDDVKSLAAALDVLLPMPKQAGRSGDQEGSDEAAA